MIGGLKRTSSRLAIAAAASMFVGGAALTPAQAADLGGDCCADLEERVAELEATAVRHRRRQMRLVLSGQVNSALLFWDNGEEDDIYVIDNDESSTRINLRFEGTAVPGVTVGGQIEFDLESAGGGDVSENDGDDGEDINLRRAEWFVSGDFGTVSVGQGSQASDGFAEVSFSGSALASVGYGLATTNIGGFSVFNTNTNNYVGRLNAGNNIVGSTIFSISSDFDPSRRNRVRYDSPTFAGFTVSTSWGEDDEADVALRYSNEFNGLRVAAAAAYLWDDDDGNGDRDYEETYGFSIAFFHVPSGLHFQGGWVQNDFNSDDDLANVAAASGAGILTNDANALTADRSATNWWLATGATFRAFSLGTTDVTIQYIKTDGGAVYIAQDVLSTEANAAASGGDAIETQVYGIGLSQNIDSLGGASIYLSYNRLEAEADAAAFGGNAAQDLDVEFDYVTAGMRVRF